MELLTQELRQQFPKLGETHDKDPKDIPIIAKFFCPWDDRTWYATEFDGEDTFFGFVRGYSYELTRFSLSGLERKHGWFRLGIERDLYFGDHTLAEVMAPWLEWKEQGKISPMNDSVLAEGSIGVDPLVEFGRIHGRCQSETRLIYSGQEEIPTVLARQISGRIISHFKRQHLRFKLPGDESDLDTMLDQIKQDTKKLMRALLLQDKHELAKELDFWALICGVFCEDDCFFAQWPLNAFQSHNDPA